MGGVIATIRIPYEAARMSRPRALIAEDEVPQRRRLCELLGELWPELEIVAECGDGLAALEALTSQQPEIAFLDIRMPGLTGLEVARAAEVTQVVFTTAYESHALDAFDHAAVDYLLKPIRRERLGQSIVRLKAAPGRSARRVSASHLASAPEYAGSPAARAT